MAAISAASCMRRGAVRAVHQAVRHRPFAVNQMFSSLGSSSSFARSLAVRGFTSNSGKDKDYHSWLEQDPEENEDNHVGQHGHSHGGVPCHGHSHAPPVHHGHSHGGVPCHGHHQAPPVQHGHSHGGVPCQGHGHSHAHMEHLGPCTDDLHPNYTAEEEEPPHIDVRVCAPAQNRAEQIWVRLHRLSNVSDMEIAERMLNDPAFPEGAAEDTIRQDPEGRPIIDAGFVWEIRVSRSADVYELLRAIRFVQEGWLAQDLSQGGVWGTHVAVQVRNAEGEPMLLQPGMTLNEVCGDQENPVVGWRLLQSGANQQLELETLQAQEDQDFWLRVPGATPLMRAVQDNDVQRVEELLTMENLTDHDLVGMTPLIYSVLYADDARILELLLDNGIIPSEEQALLETSMIMIAIDNQKASGDIIRALVNLGGLDPDTPEVSTSALSMAIYDNNEAAVRALLELGASRLTGVRGPPELIKLVQDSFSDRGLPFPQ